MVFPDFPFEASGPVTELSCAGSYSLFLPLAWLLLTERCEKKILRSQAGREKRAKMSSKVGWDKQGDNITYSQQPSFWLCSLWAVISSDLSGCGPVLLNSTLCCTWVLWTFCWWNPSPHHHDAPQVATGPCLKRHSRDVGNQQSWCDNTQSWSEYEQSWIHDHFPFFWNKFQITDKTFSVYFTLFAWFCVWLIPSSAVLFLGHKHEQQFFPRKPHNILFGRDRSRDGINQQSWCDNMQSWSEQLTVVMGDNGRI